MLGGELPLARGGFVHLAPQDAEGALSREERAGVSCRGDGSVAEVDQNGVVEADSGCSQALGGGLGAGDAELVGANGSVRLLVSDSAQG
ncbi:MAG: hypothetical protein ACRDOX_14760, partial [Nocardioides sp.]